MRLDIGNFDLPVSSIENINVIAMRNEGRRAGQFQDLQKRVGIDPVNTERRVDDWN